MYLAHTRPDLAYALSIVSQFIHNPVEQHIYECNYAHFKAFDVCLGKGTLFTKNTNCQGIVAYINVG